MAEVLGQCGADAATGRLQELLTKVRAWLAEQDVAFTERDVTTDVEAARALLVVGEEKVLGFQPRELSAILPGQNHP